MACFSSAYALLTLENYTKQIGPDPRLTWLTYIIFGGGLMMGPFLLLLILFAFFETTSRNTSSSSSGSSSMSQRLQERH